MNFKIFSNGFTLIELIVVMAIIGLLASVVIVAVNPSDQIARARDTSRITTISQLGRSIETYHSSKNGAFPASPSTTWMNQLSFDGDLRGTPTNQDYLSGVACNDAATFAQNGYCYKSGPADTIIYAQLESVSYNKNCTIAPNTRAYFVYSYQNARSCGYCGQNNTDPNTSSPITCSF